MYKFNLIEFVLIKVTEPEGIVRRLSIGRQTLHTLDSIDSLWLVFQIFDNSVRRKIIGLGFFARKEMSLVVLFHIIWTI